MSEKIIEFMNNIILCLIPAETGGIKLLGALPLLVKSSQATGKLIGDAAMTLISQWNCQEEIASMVFDTTSSNTGK